MTKKTIQIANLAERHFGLTNALGESMTEAAQVCLSRHHSPAQQVTIYSDNAKSVAIVDWDEPDARTKGAHNNQIDATEAGACAMSLASVEIERGLVAILRAETRTGADYYIAPTGSTHDDLETSIRLEISGVDAGDESLIFARLKTKLRQAQNGLSDKPAMAAVVGFKHLTIAMAKLT